MKVCSACKLELPLEEFYVASSKGNIRGECKACYRAKANARRRGWRPACQACGEVRPLGAQQYCAACSPMLPLTYTNGKRRRKLAPCRLCGAERLTAPAAGVPLCQPCHEAGATTRARVRRFGMTPADLETLAASGKCHMCNRRVKKREIDHDHGETGLVRGLLCRRCNSVLGAIHDDIELLRAAIAYLQDPPALKLIGERVVDQERMAKRPSGFVKIGYGKR